MAQAAAGASDEDYYRTSSRFEPEGARARQAAGENYAREGADEAYCPGSAGYFDAWSAGGDDRGGEEPTSNASVYVRRDERSTDSSSLLLPRRCTPARKGEEKNCLY